MPNQISEEEASKLPENTLQFLEYLQPLYSTDDVDVEDLSHETDRLKLAERIGKRKLIEDMLNRYKQERTYGT